MNDYESTELRGAYEDGWIYGSDLIIHGTTNTSEWRYAEYVYADSVTYLTGDTVDEIGDPVRAFGRLRRIKCGRRSRTKRPAETGC